MEEGAAPPPQSHRRESGPFQRLPALETLAEVHDADGGTLLKEGRVQGRGQGGGREGGRGGALDQDVGQGGLWIKAPCETPPSLKLKAYADLVPRASAASRSGQGGRGRLTQFKRGVVRNPREPKRLGEIDGAFFVE
jgi:hypothetical protein